MNKVMSTEKRYFWIDILKIIGCFLVLTNHTFNVLLDAHNSNLAYLIYSLVFSICKVGVPIFIMISGYLLLMKKEYNFKNIIKKIFRIFVPLFILSIYLYINYNGMKNVSIIEFIKIFLEEPIITPYWYLYMLISLYLVTPFIQKMIKNFKLNDYLFLILLCLILPGTLSVIQIYFNINISNYFTMTLFSGIIAYYIAGVYLSKIDLTKKRFIISAILSLISIIAMTLLMYIPYIKSGTLSHSLDSVFYITTIIPSLSLFYIVRYIFEEKRIKETTIKICNKISLVTFGIYLFHPIVNYRIYKLSIIQKIFSLNPYIGTISTLIVCFVFCGILTYILRKIPVIKKFL